MYLRKPRSLSSFGRPHLELDSLVEVLGVLAHDDDVDLFVTGRHPLVELAGPNAGEEVELLAEGNVDRAKAGSHGRGHRPLDGHLVVFDRARTTCGGRGFPCVSMARTPASWTSQEMPVPSASTTRRVASDTSGPMPSPGISVTVVMGHESMGEPSLRPGDSPSIETILILESQDGGGSQVHNVARSGGPSA